MTIAPLHQLSNPSGLSAGEPALSSAAATGSARHDVAPAAEGAGAFHQVVRARARTRAQPQLRPGTGAEIRALQTSAQGPLDRSGEKVGGVGAPSPSRAEATLNGTGADDTFGRGGVRAMAAQALDAEKRVEALIASAGHGRTFSAAELIALQATVFRYSQTVEVISRAADRLVGAVKQTLGTQI